MPRRARRPGESRVLRSRRCRAGGGLGSPPDILASLGERNVVVASPIGGQEFIFGRGNDQISPAVIRRSEVEVTASKQKHDDIGVLRVDTGDPDLDEELRGWQRVRVGKFERRLLKVV